MIRLDGPQWVRGCAAIRFQSNCDSIEIQRFGGGLEYLDDLRSCFAWSPWRDTSDDAIQEMLALVLEWLCRLDKGNSDIPVMVRVVEFSKCVVVGRAFNASIEDPYFFSRLQIIEHSHAFAADDCSFSNFSWISHKFSFVTCGRTFNCPL